MLRIIAMWSISIKVEYHGGECMICVKRSYSIASGEVWISITLTMLKQRRSSKWYVLLGTALLQCPIRVSAMSQSVV